MTLRHMRIFAAVCELGSVTAAAERLFIAQSAASLAISQMEDYYAQPLFNRVSNRLNVNDAGLNLYEYAAHIVKLFGDAEAEMKNWEALGILRVGASVTVGAHLLPDLVERYRAARPGTEVKAVIDNSETIVRRVLTGEIDLGLIAGSGANRRLKAIPFMEEPLAFICPASHAWAGQTVRVAELADAPLILREPGSAARDMLDGALKLNGVSVSPAWESISTQAIIEAVARGLGVSVLPSQMVDADIKAGRLQKFNVDKLALTRRFSLIYYHNKRLTRAARAFIELIEATFETQGINQRQGDIKGDE